MKPRLTRFKGTECGLVTHRFPVRLAANGPGETEEVQSPSVPDYFKALPGRTPAQRDHC